MLPHHLFHHFLLFPPTKLYKPLYGSFALIQKRALSKLLLNTTIKLNFLILGYLLLLNIIYINIVKNCILNFFVSSSIYIHHPKFTIIFYDNTINRIIFQFLLKSSYICCFYTIIKNERIATTTLSQTTQILN